jgi:hypothetical protein
VLRFNGDITSVDSVMCAVRQNNLLTAFITMGMVLEYHRVSPHNAKLLLSEPVLLHRFLGDDDEPELPPSGGFFSRLFGGRRILPQDTPSLEPRTDDDEGDADKSWHAIHYLLTGTAEGGSFPLNFILEGGQEVGDEEVGYGPARIFTPAETAEIDAALSEFTEEGLRARYDGRAMDRAKVYPQIWGRDTEDNFGYAWESFLALREFIQGTRSSGSYLLLYLS